MGGDGRAALVETHLRWKKIENIKFSRLFWAISTSPKAAAVAVDCSTKEKSVTQQPASQAMAAVVALAPASPALLPVPFRGRRDGRVALSPRRTRCSAGRCRATAQTFQGGAAASYAREMERLSAKESLLLAVSSSSSSAPSSRSLA
jgi:hypothetical protein